MNNKILGNQGEKMAADFLRQKGYKILEQNFYLRGGELDLIAEKKDKIIFVEVKTRRNNKFGAVAEQITERKKKLLINSAETYLLKNKLQEKDWQIDVITILDKAEKPEIEHFPNAIF